MKIQSGRKTLATVLVMLVIAATITWLGYHSLTRKPAPTGDNPFEYDIETYRHVPEEMIRYTQIRQIPVNLDKLLALAVAADKRICVSGDNKILQYDADGKIARSFNLTASAQCLAIASNYRLFLGVGNHIEIYDTTGALVKRWPPFDANSFITSLAVTHEAVFAADAGKLIILRYDLNGNLLNKIGEKDTTRDIPGFIIPSPYFDVAVDPDGFIWGANTGRLLLENFTPEGGPRSHWGTSSMRIEGFSGCCNPSHFAILSDGSFVTAEKGLERVKIYDRAGQFIAVVAQPSLFRQGTAGLDLAVDSDDCIYVLDSGARQVRIFQHKNSING
ncbi:MAG TPA: hypothetical protein PLP19_07295 [bacterium]|nr:hypothetical protein [bacterium]HPN43276.1 hypothetical protein [bacterium]